MSRTDDAGPPGRADRPGRDDQLVLAVDLGTGGPKVGFVSLTGRVAWQDHVTVETCWLPGGGAVQDAEHWWQLVKDAARRGLASDSVAAERVVAVAVTGQYASTVPVDEKGEPVGDCVMWMDTRGRHHIRRLIGGRMAGYAPRKAVTWLRKAGAPPSTGGGDPVSHMLFIERDLPEVAAAARWYLEPVDYLTMRFSGVAAASHASMTAVWLTDNRRLDHLDYDDALTRMAEVDRSKLPPLVATGSVVGTLRADVAAELGLSADVQVVNGMPDLHTATYGAGAVRDFEANMAISTTSWISAPVPFKRTDVAHGIASIPGTPPGRYLIIDNQDSAGAAFQWLRDVLADERNRPGYDELTALAAQAPPGAGGVVFTPWLKGERSPIGDPRARGGFHNVSLLTTRADMVRAVLEGVAYNSRFLLTHVERFAKQRLDDIRLIGGGASSDLWCQIVADVTDRTIERVHEPLHAGIRGAAVFAGIVLGQVRPDEVRGLVRVDARFEPDPSTRATYDRLGDEVPRIYKSEKAMFARLNGRRSSGTTTPPPDGSSAGGRR